MPEFNWQALYKAALTETDLNKLNSRIAAARHAIDRRLERIAEGEGNTREREQLDRALHALFTLPARKRSA
jgi:hypothetical protein